MNPEGVGGEQAVVRPWEEDAHKVTRQSPVDMAQEIVRECLLDRLHQVGPTLLCVYTCVCTHDDNSHVPYAIIARTVCRQ